MTAKINQILSSTFMHSLSQNALPMEGLPESPHQVNGNETAMDLLAPGYVASVIPIAVVGMGCRFPGGSSNPEKLWEMLASKRSGWSKTPADRFTQHSFQHPSSSVSGTVGAHQWRGRDHHLQRLTFDSSMLRERISLKKMSQDLTQQPLTSALWNQRSVQSIDVIRFFSLSRKANLKSVHGSADETTARGGLRSSGEW